MNSPVPSTSNPSSHVLTGDGLALGKTGRRYTFGTLPASALREKIRLAHPNLSGRAVTLRVNEALRDERSQRSVLVAATIAELANRNLLPDTVDLRRKTACIRFVKVTEAPKPSVEKAKAQAALAEDKLAKVLALLSAKGVSAEEIASAVS